MNFKRDFLIGKIGQDRVKSILEKANIKVEFSPNKEFPDWDIKCVVGRKNFTGEIKYDVMSDQTGNIAIEYYNSAKKTDSGLMSTKANLWFHIISTMQQQVWVATVEDMKTYIRNNKPFKTLTMIGDGNADIHLYKIKEIMPSLFVRIDNLEPTKLVKTIKSLLK